MDVREQNPSPMMRRLDLLLEKEQRVIKMNKLKNTLESMAWGAVGGLITYYTIIFFELV